MVARLTEPMAERLAGLPGHALYFEVETAKEAIRERRPFHILSMVNVTKFDFFRWGSIRLARRSCAGSG